MNIAFKAIRDEGQLNKERLVLRVVLPDDIGKYLVCETEAAEDGANISNNVRRAYWFPDQKVKTGDLVVLYTKDGVDKIKKHGTGSTSHFFYWGLPTPIWNEKQSAVVIIRASEWAYEVLAEPQDTDDTDE